MRTPALVFAYLSIFAPFSAYGHGGGVNSYGCHYETATTAYHCHQGPLSGQLFSSESGMITAYNDAVGNPKPDPGSGTPGSFAPAYNRDDYITSWKDLDSDCMNGRHEVLVIESRIQPTLDPSGCYVQEGEWYDPFTGQVFTDPGDLQIDHMVSLKEAHDSGAHAWEPAKKSAFAQDLLNAKSLIAVSGNANQSKGSSDPAEWLPPNSDYHCEYVRNWVEVKHRYGLSIDEAERAAIENVLGADFADALRTESLGWDEIAQQPSSAVFGLGVRKLDHCGYTNQALPSDQIEMSVSITPDPEHVEQKFDIYLVADLPAGLFSLDIYGDFHPFYGDIATLVPHREDIYLVESREISIFTGALNDELVMNLFIGFSTDGGDFVYTSTPLPFRIHP